MCDPNIDFDQNSEEVRSQLQDHISSRGIMQNWIAKQCNLSATTISLFLNHKRLLPKDKLEIIKTLVN